MTAQVLILIIGGLGAGLVSFAALWGKNRE